PALCQGEFTENAHGRPASRLKRQAPPGIMHGVHPRGLTASVIQPEMSGLFLALWAAFSFSPHILLSQTAQRVAEQAAQKIDAGDLEAARRMLASALKLYPRSITLHKLLATLEFKEQHFDVMRAELLRA